MPLPVGMDQAYVWCLLWFLLESGLAGLLTQQLGSDALDEPVRSRTYARLGRLNDYLWRQFEIATRKAPTDDLVLDLESLRKLEAQVGRASAIDHAMRSRTTALAVGRLAAVVEVASALVAAVLVAIVEDRSALTNASLVAFAVGTAIALGALIYGSVASVRLQRRDDYL